MATYQYKTNKGTFEIESNRPLNQQELQKAIGGGFSATGKVGSFLEGIQKGAPGVGQFAGGLVGGALGTKVGKPFLGGAVGGTAGRVLGEFAQQQAGRERDVSRIDPLETVAGSAAFPFAGTTPQLPTQGEAIQLAKTAGITGLIESATAGLAKGAIGAGRGLAKGFLGKRLAQRGFDRQWKNLIKPEFFKGKIPDDILSKIGNFFPKLKEVAGDAVGKVIKNKHANTFIDFGGIRNLSEVLPEGVTMKMITDSPGQQKTITKIFDLVKETSGKRLKLESLWNIRRRVDAMIGTKSLSEGADLVAKKLRDVLNKPIVNAGTDVAEVFTRYHGVMKGADNFGKNFIVAKTPSGNLVSPKVEGFAKNLLTSSKDEQIRWLKELDGLLGADDKIITKFLDYAASEMLEGEIGFSVIQKMLLGLIGGRKVIPNIGRIIQSLPVQAGARLGGRAIPTVVSGAVREE